MIFGFLNVFFKIQGGAGGPGHSNHTHPAHPKKNSRTPDCHARSIEETMGDFMEDLWGIGEEDVAAVELAKEKSIAESVLEWLNDICEEDVDNILSGLRRRLPELKEKVAKHASDALSPSLVMKVHPQLCVFLVIILERVNKIFVFDGFLQRHLYFSHPSSVQALDSCRELEQTFGLETLSSRLMFDKLARHQFKKENVVDESSKTSQLTVTGTRGAIYDDDFLDLIQPLYDMHMGVENMGPLLYSLVRFLKPLHVLEIGAGYTSIYLLQALKDNHEEMLQYQRMQVLRRLFCRYCFVFISNI